MDGSAKDFLEVLNKNPINYYKKRKILKIEIKFELVDGDRKISIEPNDGSLEVEFELKYENQDNW